MHISINPGEETPHTLRALAAMLTTLAGGAVGQITQADRPDTGAKDPNPCKIVTPGGGLLSGGTVDLAAAFGGAGNGAAPSATAPSPPPVLSVAPSPTIPTPGLAPAAVPDLAAAFGGNSVPNGAPVAPALIAAPAPPANVPSTGTPPAPPNGAQTAGASIDLDTDGLPWNAEIHSSNKKKAATGKWMARRNVADATLERVTAQLRAAVSVGNVPQPPAPPPPPGMTPTPPPLAGTTTATEGSNLVTLPMLLPRITTAMAAGHLTAEAAAAIAMQLSDGKINNVAMLAVAPQLIPAFWDRLTQLGIPL